ncbi:periplasmic nitrate reductase, electron transfer subunit [Campylobacterota bacterium]|nr:periplasmic nitrate reductase, electron transfer subunit [Campylobacterota bacterium]
MKTKLMWFAAAAATLLIFGCVAKNSVSDVDLGLRHTDLLNDSSVKLRGVEYDATPAGESKLISRAFENAPPMISHDVEGMTEMGKDGNQCTACHLPEMAAFAKATPMPKTHFVDIRNDGVKKLTVHDLGGKMSDVRYNCTQCHVPQAVGAAPTVENTFGVVLRNEKTKTSSNLIDTLNDGVR